jgi:hypothetical protein
MEAGTAAETEARETIEEAVHSNGGDPAPQDPAEHSPAEHRGHQALFKHSTYVHVGPDADECEHKQDGSCENPQHFHAWCRIPNQFQHASLREKGMAAKARKLRQLRDPESDARVVLDSGIEELIAVDAHREMVDELVAKDFVTDYMNAAKAVGEEDEFKTIEEDRERNRALTALPEDQRPAEEWKELQKHLTDYGNRVQEEFEANQKPLRESLESKTIEELGALLREQRMEQEAQNAFNAAYSQWEHYIGTLKGCSDDKLPTERYFSDINQMIAAAPEVVEALEQTFERLDAEATRASKNS